MRALFLILIAGFLVTACASLDEDECRAGDWSGIGFADGTEGRLTSFLERHAKACAEYGVTPDQQAWLLGREEGLIRYCTPAKAYLVGREGQRITPVCTPAALAQMQPAWDHGRNYWRIRNEINHLRSDRRQLRSDLAGLSGDPESASLRSRVATELSFIDLDILRLEARLRRYDSWPP